MVTVASVAGAMALLPSAVAFANEGGDKAEQGKEGHRHHHHGGLMSAALKLDSLSGDQRTQIEKLESTRKTAEAPVRAADARVLTDLARQVEQDHVDRAGLADGLAAETAAAQGARQVDVQTLTQLHGLLTPAQRTQLVDKITARMPADKPRPAELEAFKGDAFDANAMAKVRVPGEHVIAMAEKRVPSMTPAERAKFAEHLRARAAHDTKG